MSFEWLKEHYIDHELSGKQIATLAGVGHSTIEYWLKRHQIPQRSKVALLIARNKARAHLGMDTDTLARIKQLHEQGLTQPQIAEHLGVTRKVIRRRFRLLGLQGYCGYHREALRSS